MKTRHQPTGNIRKHSHRRRPGTRNKAGPPLSRFQRLTGSWAINALVVPLLVSLVSAVVTLLLSHWGR